MQAGRARIAFIMEITPRFLKFPDASFFLFGPRGTGKSTWLRAQFPDALWIDLLLQEQYQFYLAGPDRLKAVLAADKQASVVVVDEIQRVPQLLNVVHLLIEENPEVRFVLTGSSARKLRRSGVDLLAGRAVLQTCHPFLAAELGKDFSLDRALQVGLVPLIHSAPDSEAALKAYMSLYLREEVQAEGLVRDIGSFARFLEAISFSHGAVLNIAEVSRECSVSRKTVEGYVEILGDLLLAHQVPVFAKRAKRQLIKHAKLYLFDAGVYRALRPKGPLDRPSEIDGAGLEGLVFQHLHAWNEYSGGNNRLYFWRTKSGNEVDFVVYGETAFAAIEVKNAATVQRRDLRGLRAFGEDYPEASRILLYRGERQIMMDDVLCMPCEKFLRGIVPSGPLVP